MATKTPTNANDELLSVGEKIELNAKCLVNLEETIFPLIIVHEVWVG